MNLNEARMEKDRKSIYGEKWFSVELEGKLEQVDEIKRNDFNIMLFQVLAEFSCII